MTTVKISDEARQRLRDYVSNPPAGSALREAVAFGIDPTMTLKNMFTLTLEERIRNGDRVIHSTAQMIGLARNSGKTR